ncbi:CU044_2847 family protein [Streptomyces sp. NPDC004838]
MREVSRFRLMDGSVVNMQVDADDALDVGFRDHRGHYESRTTLGAATRSIGMAVSEVVHNLINPSGPRRPTELVIEFNVRLDAETGATIVKNVEDGHFHIKATWDGN